MPLYKDLWNSHSTRCLYLVSSQSTRCKYVQSWHFVCAAIEPTLYQQENGYTSFQQLDPYQNKIVLPPLEKEGVTRRDVYDPRTTGYGTSYRSYVDPLLGQPRYYYKDIDQENNGGYLTRNNVDFADFGTATGNYPFHKPLEGNALHQYADSLLRTAALVSAPNSNNDSWIKITTASGNKESPLSVPTCKARLLWARVDPELMQGHEVGEKWVFIRFLVISQRNQLACSMIKLIWNRIFGILGLIDRKTYLFDLLRNVSGTENINCVKNCVFKRHLVVKIVS